MNTIDPAELQRNASRLFRSGQAAEAIEAYRRLLAVRPDLPNSWFNLAIMQRRMGQPEAALASYDRALQLDIDAPEEVHLQRGVIFADDLGDSAAARAELDTALALNPDYLPAWLNLGNWHEDHGDWPAARNAYRAAVALDPEHALGLARLAGVSDIASADDPLLQKLRSVARSASSPEDRADTGFVLGTALDRLGEFDRAFAAYSDANDASRQIAVAAGIRYDRPAQEALIDRLIAAFPKAVATTADPDPAAPLFVCGMFRSGSTLVERMLARHSRLAAGGELDALPRLIATSLPSYPDGITTLGEAERLALRAQYLASIEHRQSPGVVLIDKRPDNFLHIGLIKTLFPTARIVRTVRDPRDTALSVFFLHAAPLLAYATDLGDIAHYHRQEQRLMAHWQALFGADIVPANYDDLIGDPADTVAALLAACDLPWEDQLLDHRVSGDAVRTASHWQVRQPLYRRSSGRWRNYARHLDMTSDMQ